MLDFDDTNIRRFHTLCDMPFAYIILEIEVAYSLVSSHLEYANSLSEGLELNSKSEMHPNLLWTWVSL